jgi:hypothetical protein
VVILTFCGFINLALDIVLDLEKMQKNGRDEVK